MNYKNKYLKYKNKYIKLKNMIGGTNTFTIYTTGIFDWGKTNLFRPWQIIKEKIIHSLPEKFTNINIKHYDPLIDIHGNKINLDPLIRTQLLNIDDNNCEIIESHLPLDDESHLPLDDESHLPLDDESHLPLDDESHSFFNEQDSYIIIDFAHIFEYTVELHKVKLFDSHKEFSLNAIYLGYLGELQPKEYCLDISNLSLLDNLPFIIRFDNGELITYIDYLIINHHDFNKSNPQDYFYDILIEFRRNIFNDYRDKNSTIPNYANNFDLLFNRYCRHIYKLIFEFIYNFGFSKENVLIELFNIYLRF